ncbi:unnamed protein product [Macrosiphum euphorbiae]|uniref:SWIM-type domain-containing protein n=1 Tax=Macrosiphum euphorbiae TaxID=13131 RepID=A0AAV0XI61_9HEMI|nr:unnamed protein product [Macrosiphum euphorbiae]
MPHSIFGELTKPEVEIIKFKCSCKAGASECCKHVVAILLFINRSRFIAAAPTSAIALHSLGRNLPTNQSSVILAENTQLSRLNVSLHPLSVYLQNYPVMNMGDCCKESFSKLSTDFYEVLYRSQKDKSFWDHCRQYRTTGSRC